MKFQFKILLVLLSVALNVAFLGSWIAHAVRASENKTAASSAVESGAAMPALYRQLGLTEHQWQEIHQQLDAFRASALALFERINERRQELLALLAAPQADRAAIAEKQNEIRAAQTEMQNLVIAHLLAEKESLTPAQRQKYFDLLTQRSGTLCENMMEGLRPATTSGGPRKAIQK
ncbi:MAG: periplasmic heavy metal sensor [Verrucomicrobia bacterium]|nr:periplasmic heavy metal sensor [Verrucomicrobiota bacterium]